MFLLVSRSAHLRFSCFTHGRLYSRENEDCQINMDCLFKFQYPDRDTSEENMGSWGGGGKAAVLEFTAFFVTLQTAALHSKDITHIP